jgi:hypothetical protein
VADRDCVQAVKAVFSRIIRDERDFAVASGYIDGNPVKAKQVKVAKDWKFGGLFHKLRRTHRPPAKG